MGLKGRLEAGESLLGVLLRMPADELVEMCAVAGFDFVLVDCEHGPADVIALRTHLAVGALHGVPVVVRTGAREPGLVLRALDAGAAGVVAPHIDTAEEAAALVDSAHYPPLGHRGFATYSRAGRYGQVDPASYQQRAQTETLVFGMIESPRAVGHCVEILRTPGLDGIMIGTADLRAATTEADPPPAESIATVQAAVAASGRWRMDIVTGPEAARDAFATGARLVVYNLTHTLMEHLSTLLTARP